MIMGLKQCRKWAISVTLLIISSNLVLSETILSSGITEPGRRLLQTQDESNNIVRTDPLYHFHEYRGRYDITSKHYWSSTIFTGIYGYAMGLLLLLAGAAYSIYLLSRASCFQNKNGKLRKTIPCRKQCYLCPVTLSTVLAILAIIGSGVALQGNVQFHSRAKMIMNVIVDTADQASNTMYNATGVIRKISINLKESGTFEGDEAANFLASTSDKLGYEATDIENHAQKNRGLVRKALTLLSIVTTVTISLSLAAVISLTAFGILRFRRTVQMLVIFCWLLTVLSWVFFGGYFFLAKFIGDTCTALHDFQKTPENSSLSTILPCDELLSARTVLSDVSVGIYDIVSQVNANITLLGSISLPGLDYVCNPFSGPPDYSYQPEDCPANSIHIRDIPQVLKMFTCADTTGTTCEEGFITTGEYNTIETYTTSVQSLLDAYPEMENLVDCRFVKSAFSDILVNHCNPMKRNVKTTWIAIIFLSVVMMFLVLLWASTMHHEQQHHLKNGSVKPSTTEPNDHDLELAKISGENPSSLVE